MVTRAAGRRNRYHARCGQWCPFRAGDLPDRLMTKFEWVRMVQDLPASSPLWSHKRCGNRSCWRRDGSQLSTTAVKHVCEVLSDIANEDGTHSHLGLTVLADKTSRDRHTVSAAVLHLEAVGLIVAAVRGGQLGLPRDYATDYWLASPGLEIRAGVLPAEQEERLYERFSLH